MKAWGKMITAFATVLLVGCSSVPLRKAVLRDVQGDWQCVNAVIDGKPLSEAKTQKLHLALTADRYKTMSGSEVLFDSTYEIDTSVRPPRISMVGTEGDLTGKVAHGIFELNGDTLRICYSMPGKTIPIRFESAPGSEAYLIECNRIRLPNSK